MGCWSAARRTRAPSWRSCARDAQQVRHVSGNECSTPTEMLSRSILFLRPRLAQALRPVQAQAAAMYHENVIDHYENPRNVGTWSA